MTNTYLAQRVQGMGTTIFTEMTALAQQYNAVNLGQGFPDFPAPDFIKQAAVQAILADHNQYAPMPGLLALRQVVAENTAVAYHHQHEINPDTHVTITHGATEAIFATMMGLINPEDEVILFEPYYDSYVPSVNFAGGVPRFYTLRSPTWAIDPDQLESLFNHKTKLIVVNTPHNPTGKVFSHEELALIARLCVKYDVLAVVDAVYEHILFDDAVHLPLATLPGMWERTLMISSVGKTFSVTGWKTGWVVADEALTTAVRRAHQFITFATVTPMQAATATALTQAAQNGYYQALATMYQARRDLLVAALRAVGFKPLQPQGTYFVMVDISDQPFANDIDFCRYLTTEVGVAAIPPSAFYHRPADGAHLARFTFCKQPAALDEAVRRLKKGTKSEL